MQSSIRESLLDAFFHLWLDNSIQKYSQTKPYKAKQSIHHIGLSAMLTFFLLQNFKFTKYSKNILICN